MKKEEIKEEKKLSIAKFTRQELTDDLTLQNVKDIIESQETEIKNLDNDIENKKKVVEYYSQFLDKF